MLGLNGKLIGLEQKLIRFNRKYRENSANINWSDDDTVSINGVTLNVPDETYDFRDNE